MRRFRGRVSLQFRKDETARAGLEGRRYHHRRGAPEVRTRLIDHDHGPVRQVTDRLVILASFFHQMQLQLITGGHRTVAGARPLQCARLPCHRHARQLRRRRGLRASASSWTRSSQTALGIAGTQAAGLKSMFGTMCKPLHAGKAAYHGAFAARLAQRGFTSRADVLECPQGFARTHSPDFNPSAALADTAGRLPHPQQPLQVPCRLLHDACADRGCAQAARTARPHGRRDRPASGCGLTKPVTASATFRRPALVWKRNSVCG